jgi:membrane carboxypeptidase/penicillin-binding protein
LIEWGPGIYGINQASHFYFNKKPDALNLQEAIYLASIVPHPKWYKYTFETNGVPKPFFANYFHRMEQLMVRKQFIAETDTVNVPTSITLTGVAAGAFAVADTLRADSVILQELEIIPATVE